MSILSRKKTSLNMLTDTPGKALFFFAVPIILGNLFQQFYNMVDGIVVARFVGEEALAAVGTTYSLANVFIAVATGAGIGSSVVISQFLGARQIDAMKKAITTTLINFLVLSVVMAAIGLLFCDNILYALNTPDNVFDEARTYLSIYFWGLPFLFLYNALSSVFNALGDSKTPLKLLIMSSLTNVVLDLVFVVFFHMAVAGVAIATLIAQGISAVLSFYIMTRRLQTYPSSGRLPLYDRRLSLKIIKIAIPSIIQQTIVNLGMLLVQSVVNSFGSQVMAGYAAASRFEGICVIPMVAVGTAVSTFTAQNMGAGQTARVRKGYHASYRLVIAIAIILCLILELFGDTLITAFLDGDSNALAFSTGIAYMKFLGFFYVLIGFKCSVDGVLRGSGDTIVFTVANLVNLTIRVAFAHIFAPVIGVSAVWYAVPLGWLSNYLISFFWYLRGKWQGNRAI